MADLKLHVLDAEDLAVLSAQCQDAVVRAGDLAFLPREKRFVLAANRFDWAAAATKARGSFDRRRAGLRFEAVRRVQVTGFDPRLPDTVLVLLAVVFEPGELPAGRITLQFAAGAALRLDVDYIEAELKDLGPVWSTTNKPDHAERDPADPAPDKQPRS